MGSANHVNALGGKPSSRSGTHLRVCVLVGYTSAWRMAVKHKPRRTSGGEWVYPRSEKARKEAGLQTMEHYLQKRRDTIAAWVVDRPLLAACKGGERRRGTPRHTWWWEQEFSLDEESPDRGDSSDGDSSSKEPDSVGGAAGA